MLYCTLEADVNECPYFQSENGLCKRSTPECGFCYEEFSEKKSVNYKYVREPRWYEKYYKNGTMAK